MTKRHILVTAGNTSTPIDHVRIITNIFTGETGLKIALQCARRGFFVTLILADYKIDIKKYTHKRLRLIRAITFDRFYKAVKREVKREKYLAIIHAAAVSDFVLKKPFKGKVSSKRKLKLTLSRAPKIVDKVRDWNPNIKLIKFKLEANKSKKQLIKIALKSKKISQANLVVANKLPLKKKHIFFLVKNKQQIRKISGKRALAKLLARILSREL